MPGRRKVNTVCTMARLLPSCQSHTVKCSSSCQCYQLTVTLALHLALRLAFRAIQKKDSEKNERRSDNWSRYLGLRLVSVESEQFSRFKSSGTRTTTVVQVAKVLFCLLLRSFCLLGRCS